MLPSALSTVLGAARPWALFAMIALVPAATMAGVAIRATASEEAANEREVVLGLQASARRLHDAVEKGELAAVARLREAREDAFDEGAPGLARALAPTTPAFADSVAFAPTGARILPPSTSRDAARASVACAALAASYGALSGTARAEARASLTNECAEARGPSGRWMYPLVALDAAPVDDAALGAWLAQHAAVLREGERAALAGEIARSPFVDAAARARLEALGREGTARDGTLRMLLEDGLAREIARAKVDGDGIARIVTPLALGYVRLLRDGRRVGFVTHAASLDAALPALLSDASARAAIERAGAATPTLAATAIVAPSLRVLITPHDPHEVTRRTAHRKAILLAAGGLSASLALGLALYLFAQMRAARRLGELRTDFVAAVSHELRTPVASIRMLAELLEQQKVDAEEAPEVHATLAREARRLGETVQRLLGFGAMARGKIAASPKPEDIAAVVEGALDEIELDHPSMPKVTRSIARPIEGEADAALIRVALHNLLENALKYAGESAPFEVTLRTANGAVALTVRDHGPGIHPRDQRRIFEPFERADNRLSRATEGSGIGLSLVRHIARAHGGDVHVESAIGAGAAFTVTFPLVMRRPEERGARGQTLENEEG